MLCYLDSIEERPREGKVSFFICTWKGQSGDADAQKIVDRDGRRTINLVAAKAREITITKSIFPTDEEQFKAWGKELICRRVLLVDKATGELKEYINEANVKKTYINLLYVNVPLASIHPTCRLIEYYDKSGNLHKSNTVTVVGFADENDIWAEDLSPEDMAKNNLLTNLNNGTYTDVTEETTEEVKTSNTSINSGNPFA